MHVKKFLDWIGLKEKLHSIIHKPPFVSEGEIRKLASGFYLIIPLTTQVHNGTWYVNFKQKGVEMSACLHQIRSMDHRRLFSCLGELDDIDLTRVREGFLKLCH